MEDLLTSTDAIDGLVRLAAIGTSGICVLAVAVIGWMLSKTKGASDQWHKTVRLFMGMCLFSAVITGATGIANAIFNSDKTQIAVQLKTEIYKELDNTSAELISLQSTVKIVAISPDFRSIEMRNQSLEVQRAIEELRRVEISDARRFVDPARLERRPISD
jgi:hypothetical protein